MYSLSRPESQRRTSRRDLRRRGPPVRRGRPVGNHQQKRTRLLQAVVTVISHQGYVATSMRKVAQQACCTTGAETCYFANREQMVIAAAQYLFDELDVMLSTGAEQLDLHTLIKQGLDWMIADGPHSWLAFFRMMAHVRHEPWVRRSFPAALLALSPGVLFNARQGAA